MKISTVIHSALLLLTGICTATAQVNPTANRISLDISRFPQNPAYTYDSCRVAGTDLGMSQVGLFQNWTAIETSPLNYNMQVFDIANIYYPAYNLPVDLTITPIHTNNLEVPSDLVATAFSSITMINRFNRLLDSVKAHTPALVLSSLVIGSEHDVYMGSNATRWSEYTTFYDSVSAHARSLWPGIKIATELTFGGLTTQNAFAQTLNTNSDYIGVSYYPLNNDFTVKPVSVIPTDFATLTGLYPNKKLCFYQYGYPSSLTCNSSDVLQAQFIAQTFTAWDTHAANIYMIDFTWLHDMDSADVVFFGNYYGITDTVFLEYLHTLGLRYWNGSGTDKPAMHELRCQARQRAFNNLNINCALEINEQDFAEQLLLLPNPASDLLFLQGDVSPGAQLQIFNACGALVMEMPFTKMFSTAQLPEGLYTLRITAGNRNVSKRFVVTH